MFLAEIFHDAAIQVCFGVSVFDKHTFDFHEFIVFSIICAGDFLSSVK